METIGLSSPRPSALCAGWEGGNLGIAMSRDADTGKSYFLATLLAIAGHDLRQPLQMITNAHDVLARTVHSGEQREELAEAKDATGRLATMLGQLVEALQLHEQSGDLSCGGSPQCPGRRMRSAARAFLAGQRGFNHCRIQQLSARRRSNSRGEISRSCEVRRRLFLR